MTLPARRASCAALAVCLLLARAAAADAPAPPPPPPPPAAPATDEEAKLHAKELFDDGNAHLAAGETEAAVSAFLASRAMYPTRGNTLNAALLLHRLGRHDESLELYLILQRSFPLNAQEKDQVDREVALLRELTGRLEVTAEPGATISVDGRERGRSPLAEPIIVLTGRRVVRVSAPGRAFETSIVVNSGQVVSVAGRLVEDTSGAPAALTTAPPSTAPATPVTKPQEEKPADFGFIGTLSAGPAVGTGFGGPLADACEGDCQTHAPFGLQGLLRGGLRFGSGFEAGLELGWTRLAGRYEKRKDFVTPVGGGEQPGTAEDDLTWSATMVGAHGGWVKGERITFRVGLGAGFAFAVMKDQRRGTYDVTPPSGDPFSANVRDEKSPRGTYAYLEPEVGVGLRLSQLVELSADLALLTAVGMSTPHYESGDDVVIRNPNTGRPDIARFRDDELTGTPFFAFVPRLGVTFRP